MKSFSVKNFHTGAVETFDCVADAVAEYRHTLLLGKSYECQPGSAKINVNPKTKSSFVSNVNKSLVNAAYTPTLRLI